MVDCRVVRYDGELAPGPRLSRCCNMKISSGHWYAVLSSRELHKRPFGATRFGERLVFWRDSAGKAVCFDDRCPHRGAALSQGRLHDGTLACPYHGFRYDSSGRCVEVPAEGTWHIPEHFRAGTRPVKEEHEFVWLWRGPEMATEELPPVPQFPLPDGTIFGESIQHWPTHYTRCIEGVIDHSHLPFVHRKSLGIFIRNPLTRIKVEPFDGGFRSNMLRDDRVMHHVDFVYPNVWIQNLSDRWTMSATFAPIDDTTTAVYNRWHHKIRVPLLRSFVNLWGRFSVFMVFHEDMAILATQQPANTDDAAADKLVPSDAAQMEFRKMRTQYQKEFDEVAEQIVPQDRPRSASKAG